MKLQFQVQQHQTEADDAVVEFFAGEPKRDGVLYRIDPGRAHVTNTPAPLPNERRPGLRPTQRRDLLTPRQLLANVHAVQKLRCRSSSRAVVDRKAAPRRAEHRRREGDRCRPLVPVVAHVGEDVGVIAERVEVARKLEREIAALQRKLRNEPQLNRKVELRRTLKTKQAMLGGLTSRTP